MIHTCNICDRDAHDLLDAMNFQQYVFGQTHNHGHTWDLVISRKIELLVQDVRVSSECYSDH